MVCLAERTWQWIYAADVESVMQHMFFLHNTEGRDRLEGISFAFEWEVALMEWIQAHLGISGIRIMSLFTTLGEELVLIGVIGFIYFCYDKAYGKRIGCAVVTALVWNPMAKNLVFRRRPYFDHPGIRCLKPVEPEADIYNIAAQGYSFPSGHSTNAAAAYGSVFAFHRNRFTAAVGFLFPFLVGISRFCVGVHYPTDVLVGWIMGVLVILILTVLEKKLRNSLLYYGLLAVSGLPGIFFCKTADYFTAYGLMLGVFCAFLFEERFVKFEGTRNPSACVFRILGAMTGFLLLSVLFKLPFSDAFLASESFVCHLVRLARYFLVSFLTIGVYPMCFRLFRTPDSRTS